MTKATELSVLPSFIAANTTVVSVNATSYNIGSSFIANSTVMSANGDLRINSGYGSAANAYGVRAWINFDGRPGVINVRGSGNISSYTRNGTGDYKITFANPMPDINYCVFMFDQFGSFYNSNYAANVAFTHVAAFNTQSASFIDQQYIFVVIIR